MYAEGRQASGSIWAGKVTWQLLEPGHKASTVHTRRATWKLRAGVSWKRHQRKVNRKDGACLKDLALLPPVCSREKTLWLGSGRLVAGWGPVIWSPKDCRDQASQQAPCRPEQGWHSAWGGFPGVPGERLTLQILTLLPNTLRQASFRWVSPGKN